MATHAAAPARNHRKWMHTRRMLFDPDDACQTQQTADVRESRTRPGGSCAFRVSRCIPLGVGEMVRRLAVMVLAGAVFLACVDAAGADVAGRKKPAWMQSDTSTAHRYGLSSAPHRFQVAAAANSDSTAAPDVGRALEISRAGPTMDRVPDTIEVWPGQTAILSCVVRNQGDRVVSWIRTRDLQILTSGDIVFTSDSRFTMDISWTANGDSDDRPQMWPLTIEKVRLEDDGLYECQLNTEPKLLGKVTLVVREPAMADPPFATGAVSIDGARERSVKAGTNIRLVCRAAAPLETGTAAPEDREGDGGPLVMWYFAGKPITADTSRGGVSINTEWTRHGSEVVSTLTVARAGHEDSGTFHCEVRTLGGADQVEVVVVESAAVGGAGIPNGTIWLAGMMLALELCMRFSK